MYYLKLMADTYLCEKLVAFKWYIITIKKVNKGSGMISHQYILNHMCLNDSSRNTIDTTCSLKKQKCTVVIAMLTDNKNLFLVLY